MTKAKPCECGADDYNWGGSSALSGFRCVPHALNCSKRPNAAPKASEALVACGTCMEWDPYCEDCLRSSPPEEPAPAPEPKQGSEEPIDWEKAELWAAGTAQGDARLSQVQAARAFLALRADLAASDQNLKTMLQAAGEEAERQLAAAREEIAVRDASISDYARQMADIREHWHAEATENVTFKADLAAEKARADRAEERVMELEGVILNEHDLRLDFDNCCGREKEHSEAQAILARGVARKLKQAHPIPCPCVPMCAQCWAVEAFAPRKKS